MIADTMARIWAFSMAVDVSTEEFGGFHLDVRIRMPGDDITNDLLSFHP